MKSKQDYGLIFWTHTFLEILEILLFLLIDWQIILGILVLLQIQYMLLGGCVLARAEFGKGKSQTFNYYYLVKIFPNLSPKKTTLIFRYIIPLIVLVLAIYLQVFIEYIPVLDLIK